MAENAAVNSDNHESNESEKVNGLKRVWTDTVEQVQTRLKDVEQAFKHSLEQVQGRVNAVGEDGKKRLESVKEQLKFDKLDELVARFKFSAKAQELVDEGIKLTEETIEKLGLVKVGDIDVVKATVESVNEALEAANKKVESLRKRLSDAVSKKDFEALVARVAELEKKHAAE